MDVSGTPFDEDYELLLPPRHGQNLDILCYDLSEELRKARSNLDYEREMYEAKLQELQGLLTKTLRERDEAREQLSKLTQFLEKHTSQNVKPPNNSGGRLQWPDDQQGRNSSSSPRGLDVLQWISPHQHNNRLEFSTKADACGTSGDQHVECSNLADKQSFYQQQHPQHENNSVFVQEQPEAPDGQHPSESPLLQLVEDPITGYDVWQQDPRKSKTLGTSDPGPDAGGHMIYHHHLDPETATGSNALPPSMPRHLPAPPEADMQVILNTLPEKGKLLEAVMQAGPLLQTLLVAGPLPQWKCPPPGMERVVEVPRLSVGPSPTPFQVAAPQDLYIRPSHFHPPPNLVACSRNPSDLQHPIMYHAGSSSSQLGLSSANFKPFFRPRVPKFRS